MRFVVVVVACCLSASATNYYVSSSGGSDSNNGTSPATAWKTFSVPGNHVNAGSFSAGDVIYLKRGDVWNEQLIPPSSGASGNPIQFDAYGSGPAPVITAAVTIPFVGASWSFVSGNVWKTAAPGIVTGMIAATTVDMVQFGAVYGRHQPYGSGCTGTIVSKYDWCVVWPNLYVYSGNISTPPTMTYASDGSITAFVDSGTGVSMISIVNKSWITMQHIKVQGFSYIGVGVTGTSDNLVFANMESDGMVPYGPTPHGFYVNVSSGYGTNIQFISDDAHLNYDGFRISGAAGVTLTNCRGYANRDAGLRDATSGSASPVTYSYSHFYGNNIAQLPTSDVVGGTAVPVAGSGNISSAVPPVVANLASYQARFSFTVDDVGSAAGTESYIDTLPAVFAAHGTGSDKFNAAVVPSYNVTWSDVNSWYAGGNEIDSHSWSHQYYTTTATPSGTCTLATCPNAPAMILQYTGAGTAATLSIAGNVLTTMVTGAAGDNLTINLASSPYNTRQGLHDYLAGLAHYAVNDPTSPLARPNTKTMNLLSVTNQDIKTSAYTLVYDQTLLLPDEMTSSKSAIQSNVAGATVNFLVYPDGIEDPLAEVDAVAAGYTAARGSLAMKGQDNATGSANSVYANGVNVQNITSLSAIQIHGMTQAQVNQLAASLVFRAAAWGVPYGFFTHYNTRSDFTPDISNTELGWLLDAITANGGVWVTNAGLAQVITSGTGFSGSTRYAQSPSGGAVNLAVAQAHSPTVGRGVATAYPVDLNGVDRSKLGAWDVGASAYLSQRYGTGGGTGTTSIGWLGSPCGWPTYSCGSTSVAAVTYPSVPPNVGGLVGAGRTFVDPLFGMPGVRVTDAAFDPSQTGTNHAQFSVSNGGSADNWWWSTDSKLMLVTNVGGWRYLVGFNPATLQISRPYSAVTSGCPRGNGNCSTYGGWSVTGDVEFSRVDPCKVYVSAGTSITSYTFGSDVSPFLNSCSTSIGGPPTGVTAVNFLEASGNVLPLDFGTVAWSGEGGTVDGDALFSVAFSSSAYHYGSNTNQNSAVYAAFWSPVKGGLAINTQTGAITADPGWAGGSGLTCDASHCTGMVTTSDRFTIHNLKCNLDGSVCYFMWGTCISGSCGANNPYAWIVGTNVVYAAEGTNKTGGHWCAGYKGLINGPGSPLWQYDYRVTPATGVPGNPVALNALPVGNPAYLDQHCGWQLNNLSDTGPAVFAWSTTSLGSWGELPYDQPQGPWWNEIDLVDTNGSGLVHREALTFNTGYSDTFATANGITTASRRCVAVGSDWFNTLGNAGGTAASCIEDGPVWSGNYAYPAGYTIDPVMANNPGQYAFQLSAGCTSGGTQPATWNQTVSGTQADGSCGWINIGAPANNANQCRTDVFAWCFAATPGQ